MSDLTRNERLASFARAVPPFIGRRPQLDLLDRCLQETLAGHTQVVLIQGDAGVGKTRLLKQIRSVALHHGINACYGRCYEDLALPYLPFVESLFAQLQQMPGDVQDALGADMEIINRFLHRDNGPLPSTSPSLSAQADQNTSRLFLALSHATIKLAQSRPILLIVDDLQWTDRSSLDLFSHLVFAVADAALREPVPLFILGAHRPVEPQERLARAIARFQREEICQTLHLSGFTEGEVDELIQGLGVTRPSHQLVVTVSEATQGNPLFVQEVLHQLVTQGALEERSGYVIATASPTNLQLPAQVTTAIAARTQGLSEGCRRALTLASFLGDQCSLQMLSAVSGMHEDDLLDLLEEGIRQRLLLNEGQTFQFAHPLIRHVFYTEPIAARRQRIHYQIAQTLERVYADSREEHLLEIAHHWVNAGTTADAEKVVEYVRSAGDHAFRVFAWSDAARYYEAALSTAESTGRLSAHDRATFHRQAGLAHYRDMDVGPALAHYEKAIAAYRLTDDLQGLAQVLMAKTRAYLTQASVPYGTLVDVRLLEEVLKALGETEPRLRGHILAILAEAYWHARQTDKAEEMARRTLEIGQQSKDDALCFYASYVLALTYMQSLRPREALESWQHALVSARQADDLWLQCWPLTRIPWVLTVLGRLDEAEAIALDASAFTRKILNWAEYSQAVAALGVLAVIKGDFEAAERHAQEVMLMVRRSHYPWGGARTLAALACARALRGAWPEAEDAINMLVEPGRIFAEPGPAFRASTHRYHQLLRVYSGALEEVQEQFTTTLPRAAGKDRFEVGALPSLCAFVEISDQIGAPALTEPFYHSLSLAAERGVVFSSEWVFLIPRVLGIAAALDRRWDEAEAGFQTAIDTATRVGARPELGRAYLDYARMLADRDEESDRSRAIELLGQASLIFNELGMEPFAERAARLAEALHSPLHLPRRPALATDNLTGREVEILHYVVRSRTDQEIADELLLRPETVGHYVSTILAKSGGKERGEITAYGAAMGLSSPTLVILFTDIVGSTPLLQRLGNVKAQPLFDTHDKIILDCLQRYRGSWIKHTGDGVMATFPSAVSAIECTVAIQKAIRRAFATHNQEHSDIPMRVRSGLHAGEIIAKRGQWFGIAINAARRICDHAQPDQILVSDVIRQLVAGSEISFTNCGDFLLKGLQELFRLYAVQWEDEGT
jgi:class 3 adenylate cyclase/tetratricopeptide (TPR) repeat protein